jgi:hypothetical protein
MARRNVEAEIERLTQVRDAPREQAAAELRSALADRVNLLVARGARMIAELELREVIPDLLAAFDRLMKDAAERDPQCWGKTEIVKALAALGHGDAAVFLRGARHRQLERVWGGVEDMAQNLRASCQLALPACTGLARAETMRCLVEGLADPAGTVRADAVRALEQMQGEESCLLLYFKARTGDAEPAVLGQVFDAILRLERRRALPFVASFLASEAPESREEAALALGASRLEGTADLLREALSSAIDPDFRRVIMRALAASRDSEAIRFLEGLAAEGRPRDAAAAREALAILSSPPGSR